MSVTDLGLSENSLTIWKNQIAQPHGILLVTGPTGSGKTTTLYSSLRCMNGDRLNISTVEDPIEYHLDSATQIQVHEKIGMTFSAALRALLRQDPDVVMVGEIRDQETASIAVQAALTGHLVLSTLHTNDAPSSITRLINMGVEPYHISAAVNAILAQRLVRKICVHCREEFAPNEEMSEFLSMQGFEARERFTTARDANAAARQATKRPTWDLRAFGHGRCPARHGHAKSGRKPVAKNVPRTRTGLAARRWVPEGDAWCDNGR